MAKKRTGTSVVVESADIRERIRIGTARPPVAPNPLNQQHLQTLNQVIQECTQTAEMCRKCREAGIDVEPEEKANQEQLEMASRIKMEFFPHMT